MSLLRRLIHWLTRARRERLAEERRRARIAEWQHAQLKARLAMHGDEYRRIVENGESGLPVRSYNLPPRPPQEPV